jgi:hypothetical protein
MLVRSEVDHPAKVETPWKVRLSYVPVKVSVTIAALAGATAKTAPKRTKRYEFFLINISLLINAEIARGIPEDYFPRYSPLNIILHNALHPF